MADLLHLLTCCPNTDVLVLALEALAISSISIPYSPSTSMIESRWWIAKEWLWWGSSQKVANQDISVWGLVCWCGEFESSSQVLAGRDGHFDYNWTTITKRTCWMFLNPSLDLAYYQRCGSDVTHNTNVLIYLSTRWNEIQIQRNEWECQIGRN